MASVYLDDIRKYKQRQLPTTTDDAIAQFNDVAIRHKATVRGNNMGLDKK